MKRQSMRNAIYKLDVGESVEFKTTEHSEIAVRSTASNFRASHNRRYRVNRIEGGVKVTREN